MLRVQFYLGHNVNIIHYIILVFETTRLFVLSDQNKELREKILR